MDNDIFNKIITDTNNYFLNHMKIQQNLKKIILNHMQEFADATFDINPDYSSNILKIFEGLKKSLKLCNENIEYLNSLSTTLADLVVVAKNNSLDKDYISTFNSKNANLNKLISDNTLEIESFLNSIFTYSNLNFYNIQSHSAEKEPFTEETSISKEPTQSKDIKNYINSAICEKTSTYKPFELLENTLLVSESRSKVFLPYTISQITKIFDDNQDKYSSLYDVVEDKFTLPLNLFKNFPIARFREGFRLARYKEKESIKSAFDLGFELLFNYNLHPSIISACKNLNELDIYLDYLDTNETEKFDCFKIVFDIAPVLKK